MKKGGANTFLLVIIVILLAVIAYFLYKKDKTEPTISNTQQEEIVTTELPSDEILATQAKAVYQAEFPQDEYVEADRPVSVSEKVDITADGIPEILVSLGMGGATTDSLALFRMEGSKLVLAQMKAKTGTILPITLLSGGGGAGRYGSGYELLSENHAISISSYSIYGTPEDFCKSDVYQWNVHTKLFEYNQALSLTEQKKVQKSCDQAKIYLEL